MIKINVDTTSISAKVKQIEKQVAERIDKELLIFAENTVNEAKRLSPIDEGHLRGSIAYNKRPLAVDIVVATNYAAFIEFGTRRFAAAYVASLPPNWQAYAATFKGQGGGNMNDFVQRIMAWVLRKGIGAIKTKSGNNSTSKSSLDAQQEAAYGIALHILRNGIKAHPFLFPAVQHQEIELRKRLKA